MNNLETIERDIRELKERFTVHEKRHNADTTMLAVVLDKLDTHEHNHHSRASAVKSYSIVGGILAVLVAIAEAVRQLLL